MSAPRLEIDLDKLQHNARTLVDSLLRRGISVTGVTKATLGCAEVAHALLRGGVSGLGDSRIENIEALCRAGVRVRKTLIRSPMLSQTDRVVESADVSFNTEIDVIAALSRAGRKANRGHAVVLMVELGDLREGIMPGDLASVAARVIRLPYLSLLGIGANLACRSGVVPDARNMSELSTLAASLEKTLGRTMEIVSGGNSANLDWALGADGVGRVNDLRLGEAILLGCEPLHRTRISGLYPDAVTLVAEVIESKVKPVEPWGDIAQAAFERMPRAVERGNGAQSILAVGHQDTDPSGLSPPPGVVILGASSDHLVVASPDRPLAVGDEVTFELGYGALLRAATSPFVSRRTTRRDHRGGLSRVPAPDRAQIAVQPPSIVTSVPVM